MSLPSSSIGVFDSGMGGLTVLSALKKTLPQESFIYLGDTARLPYGTKSPGTVQQYALQMTRLLVERQIKALVIACNTATTVALPHLQGLLPDLPILGVVKPSADTAISLTQNQEIGIFATETTIASSVYQRFIQSSLPSAKISTRACSLLVALAEEGMVDNRIAEESLLHYLSDFQSEDTLILGCTHFPVFKPLLHKLLPKTVQIVDSAQATALALLDLLKQKELLAKASASKPSFEYLVTDSVSRFQRVGEIFLKDSLAQDQIELIDVPPLSPI